MSTKTVKIDFDAVRCDPNHMTAAGKGWARRLRELGASEAEAEQLRARLREGMAASIELARIKQLAGVVAAS
jgi:hypothetical protein